MRRRGTARQGSGGVQAPSARAGQEERQSSDAAVAPSVRSLGGGGGRRRGGDRLKRLWLESWAQKERETERQRSRAARAHLPQDKQPARQTKLPPPPRPFGAPRQLRQGRPPHRLLPSVLTLRIARGSERQISPGAFFLWKGDASRLPPPPSGPCREREGEGALGEGGAADPSPAALQVSTRTRRPDFPQPLPYRREGGKATRHAPAFVPPGWVPRFVLACVCISVCVRARALLLKWLWEQLSCCMSFPTSRAVCVNARPKGMRPRKGVMMGPEAWVRL